MKTIMMTAAACTALALGGCQKASDGTGESGNSAEAMADGSDAMPSASDIAAMRREPGMWKTTVEVLESDIPGVPESARQQMAQMMAQGMSHEMCLTPEVAESEDIAESMAKMDENSDCRFERKSFTGGNLDVAGTCTSNGQSMTMALQGKATPTSSDMTMTTSGDGPMGTMSVKMRVQSERTGDCEG